MRAVFGVRELHDVLRERREGRVPGRVQAQDLELLSAGERGEPQRDPEDVRSVRHALDALPVAGSVAVP